jgi:hypothetical protein
MSQVAVDKEVWDPLLHGEAMVASFKVKPGDEDVGSQLKVTWEEDASPFLDYFLTDTLGQVHRTWRASKSWAVMGTGSMCPSFPALLSSILAKHLRLSQTGFAKQRITPPCLGLTLLSDSVSPFFQGVTEAAETLRDHFEKFQKVDAGDNGID